MARVVRDGPGHQWSSDGTSYTLAFLKARRDNPTPLNGGSDTDGATARGRSRLCGVASDSTPPRRFRRPRDARRAPRRCRAGAGKGLSGRLPVGGRPHRRRRTSRSAARGVADARIRRGPQRHLRGPLRRGQVRPAAGPRRGTGRAQARCHRDPGRDGHRGGEAGDGDHSDRDRAVRRRCGGGRLDCEPCASGWKCDRNEWRGRPAQRQAHGDPQGSDAECDADRGRLEPRRRGHDAPLSGDREAARTLNVDVQALGVRDPGDFPAAFSE